VDHVIAVKHGGATTLENLAVSCLTCNRRKASDIATYDSQRQETVSLFNPRRQHWEEHFSLDGSRLVGKTPEGQATIDFLQLNSFERVQERSELIAVGRYPS
jgi:hypothetical protein